MLDTIKALVSDLTQFVHIIVGLLKGGAVVLSTEGSLAGSLGGEGLGSSAADVADNAAGE
ncbi:hypothetical protein [Corynebacterium variabile]|uniref:Uncharacterized protein n=1 Tax=Corynebacterium variabile TaxID=1727 RepID=A0A4Y4C0Z7_9CORY|nr:hypothetical protein [Corynebacterium variabile]GEC86685.1 hypothetical protein CVA01_19990 [Corynebacterium variabile]